MNKICLLFATILWSVKLSYAIDIKPIENFNSNIYLGVWYEIARLPNWFENKCIVPITASYSINPENSNQIIVINQCKTETNQETATGIATFVESANIGKLKVTFLPKWLRWLPIGYGDYWILYTDYNTIAIIGSPDHKYLWILARSIELNNDILNFAVLFAQNQGFDISNLIYNYKIK